MQPISEIIKEIKLPIWICWGATLLFCVIYTIEAIFNKNTQVKSLFLAIPIQGLIALIIGMGLIFYCANDSLAWKKELKEYRKPWSEQKKDTVRGLDWRLQSIEGIIGYLDQSIKMGHEPEKLVTIMLFLAKEIKNIQDAK